MSGSSSPRDGVDSRVSAFYYRRDVPSYMDFEVVQGDIVEQSADALVNAAGTTLKMESGVAEAIRRAAGSPIHEEATSKGPVDLGEVVVTDAYQLDADHVIHAAVMPYFGDGRASAESVRNATRNALETADDLECESIVIPILGTGAAGFSFEHGARIVCEVVCMYDPETLEDVRIIAYSDEEYQPLQEIADDVRVR